MAKDLKYFMRDKKDEIVTAPGPESFKDENGNVIDFEIRVLDNETINKINESYRRRSIATDKKGNPYINNGAVVWKEEKDSARASRHIIVEALAYPDLKDKKLMEYYGCVDFTDMPTKVFSKTDEYAHVMRIVFAALGIGSFAVAGDDDDSADSDIDDAKN